MSFVQGLISLLCLGITLGKQGRMLGVTAPASNTNDILKSSWEDFYKYYLMENPGRMCRYNPENYVPLSLLPPSPFEVNWVNFGAINSVRNQHYCKSSWAFSALSAIEAHAYIQSGDVFREFSVQQILDCLGEQNVMKCEAGNPAMGFNYAQKQGGIAPSMLYTNKSLDRSSLTQYSVCKYTPSISGIQVNGGSKDIKPYDEVSLLSTLLNIGPVSVLLDGRGLKNYQSGIWDGSYIDDQGNAAQCSSEISQLNHSALLVGLEINSSTGQEYYILLNSWGTAWGENGYFRLKRTLNSCGISLCASYPRMQPF
jgi:hypothetical protein